MEMEYRRLGRSGIKVSVLSLGSWVTFGKQVQEEDAIALLKTAYDAGVNFFDNAEVYEKGLSKTLWATRCENSACAAPASSYQASSTGGFMTASTRSTRSIGNTSLMR